MSNSRKVVLTNGIEELWMWFTSQSPIPIVLWLHFQTPSSIFLYQTAIKIIKVVSFLLSGNCTFASINGLLPFLVALVWSSPLLWTGPVNKLYSAHFKSYLFGLSHKTPNQSLKVYFPAKRVYAIGKESTPSAHRNIDFVVYRYVYFTGSPITETMQL